MAQTFTQVPPNSTGNKMDGWATAVAGNVRQAVVIGDASTDANVVAIPSTGKLPVQSEQQLDYDTGAGTANLSLVGLGLPASGGPVAGGTATNPIQVSLANTAANGTAVKVDGSAVTQPVSGTVTANLGVPTSGGYSNSSINAAATNNATSVKGSAGQVYGVHVYNNAGYPVYVKLYNKATAPAPATDNALLIRRIGVQAGTQRDLSFPAGIPFSTGIGLAIVKGISDTDNTSVLASDCLAEVEYA